jgi:hypothetical protein
MAQIKLKNVRLSFPSLFHKAAFQGNETKYEGTFLLNKKTHADSITEIQSAIAEKIKTDLKGAKLGADKICLKDGDELDYDGYAGHFRIKGANGKRPLVIGKDKSPVTEDDNVFYAGCYVNAIIELWAQDNGFGKRINANLLAVQFAGDGEPFSDGGSSVGVDDFDVVDDDF